MNEDWVLISAKDPERRYRRVSVAAELIASLIGTGTANAEPVEKIPDLRIVGARFSSWRGAFEFIVTSESFEPVPQAEMEPEWTPEFRRVAVSA